MDQQNSIISEYFGQRRLTDSERQIFVGYSNKIGPINKFDKDKLKSLLSKFSDTFFEKYPDKNAISYNRINDRVNEYFNRQKNEKLDYKALISIIKYQHIISKKYTHLLGVLTKNNNVDISSECVDVSNNYKSTKSKEYIKKITLEYISNIKLCPKEKKKDIIVNNETKILEEIMVDILKKSLYNHSYLICYGSYTNHIIHNVEYDDIDVYFPESFYYLVLLMFTFKMITGLNLTILGYPFIQGHLSLFFNDRKLLDCIYISPFTLDKIRTQDISGIKFIDPLLQLLNQIRMNNELFRCNKIYENPNKYKSILYSFLLYIKDKHSKFNLKTVKNYRKTNKIDDISYRMLGDNIILINLDEFLDTTDGFDKVVIILSDPDVIIEELKSINGVYSDKYGAFLNEIFFETKQTKAGSKIENKLDRKKFKKHSFSGIIDYSKNNLIMSNLTNTLYIDIKEKRMSIRNIQSHLATIAMYSFLKNKNSFGWELFNYLISILKLKVEEDFDTNFNELKRYRRENTRHIHLNIENNTFNDFQTDKNQISTEYLQKSDFVAVYGQNGGF